MFGHPARQYGHYHQPSYYSWPPRNSNTGYTDHVDEDSYHSYAYAAEQQRQQHAYLDRVRRVREQRELEQVQARRRAQEEAYLAAQREKVARRRAAEEYRLHLEERERQRQHAAAMAAEKEQRRHIQPAYHGDEASDLFASLFTAPSHPSRKYRRAPAHTHQHQDSSSVVVQPAPLPIVPSGASPQIDEVPAKPKMDYDTALRIVQARGKQALLIRRRLRALKGIENRFESLKNVFVEPDSLDYDIGKSSVNAPILAFTPVNRPLQAYEESLTRLLVELDDIPSQGSETVKAERKQLVHAIEAELARLDAHKLKLWQRQHGSASAPPLTYEARADSATSRSASLTPTLLSEDGEWDSLSDTDVDEVDQSDVASMLVADAPSAKTLQRLATVDKLIDSADGNAGSDDDSMNIEVLV